MNSSFSDLVMTVPTIIIDTREQQPYGFSRPSIRKKLDAGDYSIEGLEDQVAVERKSMADLVHTLIRQRRRFYKELEKLASYQSACVVVEANFRDLLDANYRSAAHPSALMGMVASISANHIPVYFCSDRQAACRFVEEFLSHFHRTTICKQPPLESRAE